MNLTTEAVAGTVRGHAFDMVRGTNIDYDRLESNIYVVSGTKRLRGLTPRELARVAIDRTRDAANRLAHDTGAVNWL